MVFKALVPTEDYPHTQGMYADRRYVKEKPRKRRQRSNHGNSVGREITGERVPTSVA